MKNWFVTLGDTKPNPMCDDVKKAHGIVSIRQSCSTKMSLVAQPNHRYFSFLQRPHVPHLLPINLLSTTACWLRLLLSEPERWSATGRQNQLRAQSPLPKTTCFMWFYVSIRISLLTHKHTRARSRPAVTRHGGTDIDSYYHEASLTFQCSSTV